MVIALQKTIAAPVLMSGTGLHSGKTVSMRLVPAAANFGVVFKRTDAKEAESLVAADFRAVAATTLGTTLQNKFGVEVATVEHLLAALWGMEIDNLLIEIDAPEIPIMDGSSANFVDAIAVVGVRELDAPRKVIRVLQEIRVGDKEVYAKLTPAENFAVRFSIDFADKAIATQKNEFDLSPNVFLEEIARARTFCMKRDVDMMRAAGLALGGSLDNAIVVDNGKVLNKEGLRFTDEFVRHKILDSVGDLSLAGHSIEGLFIGHKSGHKLNNHLLRTLLDNPKAWEFVSGV